MSTTQNAISENFSTKSSRGSLSTSSPAFVGGAIGSILGIAMILLGGWWLVTTSAVVSGTLSVAIIVFGAIELASSVYMLKALRVAWAFSISINGTAAVIFLFSTPRIRDAAEMSLGVSAIPFVLFAVVHSLSAMSSEEF